MLTCIRVQTVIKIYHVVQDLRAFSLTGNGLDKLMRVMQFFPKVMISFIFPYDNYEHVLVLRTDSEEVKL